MSLHPFLDSSGILRVGGREQRSNLLFTNLHPVILHGQHPVMKLIISYLWSIYVCCMLDPHYSPPHFVIIFTFLVVERLFVLYITRACTVCRRNSAKPQPQMLGQLPIKRTTPDPIFEKVSIDYAGPFCIKYAWICS